MKLVILPEAETDLDECFWFYEKQERGIGDYFLDSLADDIRTLRDLAGVHQVVEGYYRMIARRFPHAVFYKLEEGEIRVYAVIDTRRDPKWISDRLN